MKPNFALSLSFDGIRLLKRQAAGWGRVGDVDLSSGDLTGALANLRDKAAALGPEPLQTKLVIPNEQIKYLVVDASGLDKSQLMDAVLGALDGATPYDVSELAFDFAHDGTSVHIAAVAQETLEEAEAFATEHNFAPQGFVAVPPLDAFPGEPNFGPSSSATAEGNSDFQADSAPAVMSGEAKPAPTAPPPQFAPPARNPDPIPPTAQAKTPSTAPKPEPVPPAEAAKPPVGFSSRRRDAPPAGPAATVKTAPSSAAIAAPGIPGADPSDVKPRLSLGTPQAEPTGPAALPNRVAPAQTGIGVPPPVAAPSVAPPPPMTAPQLPDASTAAMRPGMASDDAALDPIPDMPLFAPGARAPQVAPPSIELRAAPPPTRSDGLELALAGPSAASEAVPRTDYAQIGRKLLGTGSAAVAGAARSAAKLLERKPKPVAESVPSAPVEPAQTDPREQEKDRMTVFGARKKKTPKQATVVGGKPRFLGLILTAILLLFLISVAAFASVFLDQSFARLFGAQDTREASLADPEQGLPNESIAAPEVAAGPDGALQSAEDTSAPVQIAALDDGSSDISEDSLPALSDDGLSQVAPLPPVLSAEQAEARYAATGIWQASPRAPLRPATVPLNDVYLPSVDPTVEGRDAFALLNPSRRSDTVPPRAGPPLPPGANFDFDNNGFVIATPEGAVTPEGALVYSGRPPVVPPAVPEALRRPAPQEPAVRPVARDAPVETVETTSDEGPQGDPAQPEETTAEAVEAVETAPAPSLRPRSRPGNLADQIERAQLGGNTRVQLAALRPQLRPRIEKQAEEEQAAQAPPTRLAVVSSRKPSNRPNGFAGIVDRARKAQEQRQTQQEAQTTRVAAAVAPRSVTPRIPSSTSVARAATVKNAINLSRVNLIGVYGKPSSRRALVRLSSGRYKKVKVGDRVDGGRVSAIGDAQLRYNKNGRSITLKMPKG